MKSAMAEDPPPCAATYSGATGKRAAIPGNMISCPSSSQNDARERSEGKHRAILRR